MAPQVLAARTRRSILAAMIRLTPPTERHRLIGEAAKSLRDYPHPIAPTRCACGLPMRSTPETDDDGDEVHTEPMSYELDYSVGWQQAGHEARYTQTGVEYAWQVCTDSNDQHTVAHMCAGCHRLYTIPDTEEVEYV